MIGVSAGTAMVLGLRAGRADALPRTAYLMLGSRCRGRCRFCARAENHDGKPQFLSRISWPLFDEKEVLERLIPACGSGAFRRVCMQMVKDHGVFDAMRTFLAALRKSSPVPVSLSSNITGPLEAEMLFDEGLTVLSLPLDCATGELYQNIKGGAREERLGLLVTLAERYPGRIATHLIAGLGETEEEMVRVIEALYRHNISVGLFAFTPLPGTAMSGNSPPSLEVYRRLQLAHYLIKRGKPGDFEFREGKLFIEQGELRRIAHMAGGLPFETAGCPDCNRPYYNERPGRIPYNYPVKLSAEEAKEAYRLIESSLSVREE